MRIMVAGATGVMGRVLVPNLLAAGHEVWGTTRRPDRTGEIAALGAAPVVLDVLDRDGSFRALEQVQPHVVVHQITDLSGRDFEANSRVRTDGTPNLVDAAREVGVRRFIVQSVAFAYAPGPAPAEEHDPLDVEAAHGPHRNLAVGIAALEAAARRMPDSVVLRYGTLYGPGTWYSKTGFVGQQARDRELATTDGITSFVQVDDAAAAAVDALSWPSGVVNVVDDEPAPGHEWLPAFAAAVGAPPPPAGDAGEAWERGATNRVARRLGWRPRYPTWRDGFKNGL